MASQVQIPFEGVILQEHSAPISCPTPNFAKGSFINQSLRAPSWITLFPFVLFVDPLRGYLFLVSSWIPFEPDMDQEINQAYNRAHYRRSLR